MGRHTKIVNTEQGLDRRETGYYSTPAFVADFIAHTLMELNPNGHSALDPCVGRGEMAIPLLKFGISVEGIDILDFNKLPEGILFKQQDFLEYYRQKKLLCILDMQVNLPYDFYIANPPYNCHEVAYIKNQKSLLLSLFDDIGVHNMYSLFMSAIIDCAKEGALIGMITLDSFLTAKAHTPLRHKILNECGVHYLILCPNDLFLNQGADVRTCIIILQKGKHYQNTVKVANRPLNIKEFQGILENKNFSQVCLEQIILSHPSDNYEFISTVSEEIKSLFAEPRLGSKFDCVTGISTGNDNKYLSKEKREGFNIPFYKNPGLRKFFTPPNAYLVDNFLSVGEQEPNFIIRNKKLLYQPGITCSSMGVPFSACYLPANSTFGVNANIITNAQDTWWLLAYLNSHLVTFIVRGILNRSNMITSGYVSRIPIPELSEKAKEKLSQIAQNAYKNSSSSKQIDSILEINKILQEELALSDQTVADMSRFSKNILQAT